MDGWVMGGWVVREDVVHGNRAAYLLQMKGGEWV